jgi:hypothetical protein
MGLLSMLLIKLWHPSEESGNEIKNEIKKRISSGKMQPLWK